MIEETLEINGEALYAAFQRGEVEIVHGARDARIAELEAELKAAQEAIADLRDLAYNRAPKLAAEEANRQKAELEAALKEAEGKMLLMHVELAAKRAFKAELEARATTAEARAERLKTALEKIRDGRFKCEDKNCCASDVAQAALSDEEGEK